MIMNQCEIVVKDDNDDQELFHIELDIYHVIIPLSKAKEFILENWIK